LNQQEKDKIVDEILRSQSENVFVLPDYVEEKNSLEKIFENLYSEIKELLNSIFGNTIGNQFPTFSFLQPIFEILFYIFILCLFIFLIMKVVNLAKNNLNTKDSPPRSFTKVEKKVDLFNELQSFLKEGMFKNAMRTRWKIFINKMNFGSSLTVFEYASEKNPSNQLSFNHLNINQQMFGNLDASIEEYQKFDELINLIESTNVIE